MAAHSAFALGAGATGVSGANAAHSRVAADKFRAWRAGAVQALIVRADPDSLATAAALSFAGAVPRSKPDPKSGSPALDLAARASELAPQNAAIGWLRLQLCVNTPGCDIRDAATVMRWVDADNGAVWLSTLGTQREKDAAEIDRLLADMAHGTRFDLYWNRIVVLMFNALSGVRKDLPGGYLASDSARLAALTGIAGAEIIPPLVPLVEACRGAAAGTERRDVCLKLSKTMQRSDTVVAQMAGFGIERRLLAPDGRESHVISERRHLLEWRMAAAAKFDTPLLPWLKNARARARLKQMRANPREEDAGIAILREHRMAIDPKEDHR